MMEAEMIIRCVLAIIGGAMVGNGVVNSAVGVRGAPAIVVVGLAVSFLGIVGW